MIKLQQELFTEPDDLHEYDDESIVIHSKSSKLVANLVLFIHGLGGNRYGYWGNTTKFVFEDFPETDVGLYFYRTSMKRINFFRSLELEDEARVLADVIAQLDLYRSIIIIGHSLGGILAKAAIADLVDRCKGKALQRISGVILVACPQLGSLKVPHLLSKWTADGRVLFPHNRTMKHINEVFNSHLNVDCEVKSHNKRNIPIWALSAAEDFWVDPISSGIGIPEEQKLTIRGTHSSVINPKQKNADSYRFLRKCLSGGLSKVNVVNFEQDGIEVDDAHPRDVQYIRNFEVEFFGECVTPEDILVQFAERGGILHVVKRVKEEDGERHEWLSGYFCIIPLTASAVALMKSDLLRGGELTMEHVPPESEKSTVLYIGGIAANDFNSRAIVLEALRVHVRCLALLGINEVITRPLTDDGLRLARRYGFRPLNGIGGVDTLYTLAVDNNSLPLRR